MAVINNINEVLHRIGGTWGNALEPFDPVKHPVRFSFRALKPLGDLAGRAEVHIEGVAETAGFIAEITEVTTEAVNETLIPSGMFALAGHKIKIAGEHADCGVYFVNAAAPSQRVKVNGQHGGAVACGGGNAVCLRGDNSEGAACGPQNSVLMGMDGDGNTYVLEIIENTSPAASAGKMGGGYELIITGSGEDKICTGTIEAVTGSGFTLKPSRGFSNNFQVRRGRNGGISGEITLDDGTTQPAPALITPSTLMIDGEQVYVRENELAPYDGDARLELIGSGDMFIGRIKTGKLYLRSLPASKPDEYLRDDYQDTRPGVKVHSRLDGRVSET
jgi:hypothetical protein